MQFLNSLLCALAFLTALATALPKRDWDDSFEPKVTKCNLDKAVLPMNNETGAKNLTPPDSKRLVRVVLGKGTQNYTCMGAASDVPVANGAHAFLYDASCLAKNFPEQLHMAPGILLTLDIRVTDWIAKQISVFDRNTIEVGEHLFTTTTTPVFDFKYRGIKDFFVGKKLEAVSAPSYATPGAHGAVDWLKLQAENGTYGFKEVYRVVTAGGMAPDTCEGMGETFEMPYAAEYWFYN